MKGNLCRMKLIVVCRLHQLQDNLDQLLVVGHHWPMICFSPSNSPTGLGASPSFAKMACPNRSCRNSTHLDALNQPAFLSINPPSSQLALPTFLFILKFHFPHTNSCKLTVCLRCDGDEGSEEMGQDIHSLRLESSNPFSVTTGFPPRPQGACAGRKLWGLACLHPCGHFPLLVAEVLGNSKNM